MRDADRRCNARTATAIWATLSVLAIAGCFAQNSPSVPRRRPLCAGGVEGATRAVQESGAFRSVLEAVRRHLYPDLTALTPVLISYYCGALSEIAAVRIGGEPVRIVQLRIPEEPEALFVRFALDSRDEVVQLNPTDPAGVRLGLEVAAWNAVVSRVAPSQQLADSTDVRDYGCALLGLAYVYGTRGPCDREPPVVSLLSSEQGQVSLLDGRWTVIVRRDWTVRSLTRQ